MSYLDAKGRKARLIRRAKLRRLAAKEIKQRHSKDLRHYRAKR